MQTIRAFVEEITKAVAKGSGSTEQKEDRKQTCWDFQKGRCNWTNCRFKHVKLQPSLVTGTGRICWDFQQGKCKRPHCTYCKAMDRTGRITCPFNKRSYISRHNVDCTSNNLVYCLYCKVCHKIYVGQTKREVRARMSEHFTSIRKRKNHLVVGRHYNSAGHTGTHNATIFVLDFIQTHPDAPLSKRRREACEQKWIFRLRSSIPLGLNLTDWYFAFTVIRCDNHWPCGQFIVLSLPILLNFTDLLFYHIPDINSPSTILSYAPQ